MSEAATTDFGPLDEHLETAATAPGNRRQSPSWRTAAYILREDFHNSASGDATSRLMHVRLRRDHISFVPAAGSRTWFLPFTVAYESITEFYVVGPSDQALVHGVGAADSARDTHAICVELKYRRGEGRVRLRLSMVSGTTSIGKDKRCRELVEMLHIRCSMQNDSPS